MASSFPFSLEGERKRFLFHNQSHKIHHIPQFFTGSFAVDFGDHLRSRIICSTVQYHKIFPLNAFLSNFGCKIIFTCFDNFWHEQHSKSLFKGSIGHMTFCLPFSPKYPFLSKLPLSRGPFAMSWQFVKVWELLPFWWVNAFLGTSQLLQNLRTLFVCMPNYQSALGYYL